MNTTDIDGISAERQVEHGAEPAATRRGIFAALAAMAAFAGLRPTPANAKAHATLSGASGTQFGLAATHGTLEPILPQLGNTTHEIIGSGSSGPVVTIDSGVLGIRGGSGRAGVLGINNNAGFGVAGLSPSAVGVYGESGTAAGVSGKSTSGSGASGLSTSGFGVQGSSDTGVAVRANSRTNFGLRADSAEKSAIIGITAAPNVAAIIGQSSAATQPTAGRFIGNVRVQGDFSVTGAKAAAVTMPDGSLATMYCVEAPEPFFEDFGRGRLIDGRATIAMDPAFASLVNLDNLMVFLTPEGDSDGLYLHARGPESFEVRESRGGTKTLNFSWRLVAKRGDIPGERLAPIEPMGDVLLSEADEVDPRAMLAAASTRDPTQREV